MRTRSTRGRSTSQTSRGARSTRSTSRTAAAVADRRSGTPRRRGGRGRGGGRGDGSPRASSVPHTSGEMDAMAALVHRIDAMQDELDSRDGAVQQLQAELDDVRMLRQGHGAVDDAADREEPEVVVTNMMPPPPRAAAPTVQMRQLQEKEDLKAWRNPDNHKRWVLTGQRPAETTMSLASMRTILLDVAQVSPDVYGMLLNLGPFDVLKIACPGDDPATIDIPLTERIDICIDAVIKTVSRGVVTMGGRARVAALEEGLRVGARQLRRHSNECRSLMRVTANYEMMARLVNMDLNRWGGQLYEEATIFVGQHVMPPAVGDFPAVVVPTWDRLVQFIAAGGLRNSQHQPRQRSPAPAGGGGRRAATTLPSGKKGYCWAWATARGCTREERHCDFAHAPDPAKQRTARGGSHRNGSGGRRYSGGGSGGGGGSGNGGGGGSGGGRPARN